MTKKEFMGFSSAAQHDMVLEALVRVTQNLETMEKESGKPFEGTSKQRRNDIKLLTILAEAFGKNELVWKKSPAVTVDAGKYIPDKKIAVVGVGMERYNEKSMSELLGSRDEVDKPGKVYITTGGTRRNPFGEMMAVNDKIERARRSSGNVADGLKKIIDDKNKIENAQQKAGKFMSYKES
jgi:hypothetical protein